jgi:hypothetical protein
MRTLEEDLAVRKRAKEDADKQLAIHRYLQTHPEIGYQANQGLISDYLGNLPATLENLNAAAAQLFGSLAIKGQDIVEQEQAEQETLRQQRAEQERADLIEVIVQASSRDKAAQERERKRLHSRTYRIEDLRNAANEINEKKRFRNMSRTELKEYLKQQRAAGATSRQPDPIVTTINLEQE